jgi:3-methyladenine DNA glycosylase AlkD
MWVRRASIVGLIPRARKGESLDLVYEIAKRLHADREDLIQKAVGWGAARSRKTDARPAGALSARQRRVDSADDAAIRDRAVFRGKAS